MEAFQLAHQSTFQALNCGVCEQWLDIPINVNNNDAHPVVDLWHNHHLVHQNSNWNRCTFDGCYQRFEDSVELMHHARTAHQNQMGNFHCVSPNCGILFSSYNEARVHHLEVHQNGWIRCLRPAHGLGGICGLMVEGTFFEFFNVRGITFFAPGEEEVLCDLHQAAFNIGNIQ